MNKTHLLAAAALALLASAAQADTPEWIPPTVSVNSRADVNAQAVLAAAAPNQNVPATSRTLAYTSTADERAVRADAILASHAPSQNVSAGSRVNSRVEPTMTNPAMAQAEAVKKSSAQ